MIHLLLLCVLVEHNSKFKKNPKPNNSALFTDYYFQKSGNCDLNSSHTHTSEGPSHYTSLLDLNYNAQFDQSGDSDFS